MAISSKDKLEFHWVKTGVPAWAPLLGFFSYTSLILFVAFGLIPNWTHLHDAYFRSGVIALVLVIDWLVNQRRTGYALQGKLVLSESQLELISLSGKVEHRIKYADVVRYQIHDGVQFTLFRFFSRHRTLVIELALRDGNRMLFECTKWAPDNQRVSVNAQLDQRMV